MRSSACSIRVESPPQQPPPPESRTRMASTSFCPGWAFSIRVIGTCPSSSVRATMLPLAKTLIRSEEHTSELQSPCNLVCRLLLEKNKKLVPIAITTPPLRRSPPSCRALPPPPRRSAGHHQVAGCFPQPDRNRRIWFFFFNDTATTEIYTLSLHDDLPICIPRSSGRPSHFCGRYRRRPDVGGRSC